MIVAADQLRIKLATIVELDAYLLRLADDVIIGQHIAFFGVDDNA